MKKCTKCGVEKPLSEYYKDKSHKDGLAYKCKPCANMAIATWKRNNPEQHKIHQKRRDLKSKYNISMEKFNELLLVQNNKCKICNTEFKTEKGTHIDHCHTTGNIRGLLCANCNVLLGMSKDSIDILKSAQIYLKKYNSKLKEK